MPTRAYPALTGLLAVAFLIHALNYLYFFVDDEAIPFVFARHLLEGKGFVYNSFEGRVEGYSDFLHVLAAAVYLATADAMRLGPLAVFFIAKAVSLASGTALVALTASALRRSPAVKAPGLLMGMSFLVLAPPLARWSASSLEMALMALLVAIVTLNVFDGSAARDRTTAIVACLLVLLRLDGPVYVLALIGPAWALAGPERRRQMTLNIVLPVAVTVSLYHAWRIWYFGHWLSAPLAAKVLYKIHPVANAIVKAGAQSYLAAFLQLYGVVAVIGGVGLMVLAVRHERKACPLLISVGLLVAYASFIGDWMSGFRFFLPTLPAMAVLLALGTSAISARRVAWAGAIVASLWLAGGAVHAASTYDRIDYRESWWRHPSVDPARYFGPYMTLFEAVRPLAPRGTRIAYNQAGFIPYMLDADNVDDLGICSRFVADLPTTDVVFTGVGRFSPLTNGPGLWAANSYVLYRAPELIIAQIENLRSANRGEIPERILRDHYAKAIAPAHVPAVVYRKVSDPAAEFQTSPHVFLENLAHPSRARDAFVDGTMIPSSSYRDGLAFLAGRALDDTFSGQRHYDVAFATTNEPVYELTVEGVWARNDTTMMLTLWNTRGAVVRQDTRMLAADQPGRLRLIWPEGPRASRISIAFQTDSETPTRVILRDLRVQGQSPALERYVQQLSFPPNR